MNVSWAWDAWEDYTSFWQEPGNDKSLKKLNSMIEELKRNPRSKGYSAEMLKHDLKGWASMRITQEHRLVYRASADTIQILSCRFHYSK